MLNKDEQQISGVSNSTINQAKGNIINNYGISVKDVIDIVNSVVADKMSVFHKEAEETVKQRLTEFNRELIKKLQDKAEEQIGKFNSPALQLAARKAAWGYVQSGDTNDKENFVDLLIERVSVEEKSTKQHLIDEAIEILPSLSPNCLQLLTFLAFSQLMKQSKISEYENWINSINPILDNISKVTSLDIDFLNQANCTFNTVGFHSSNSFIDNQLKSCDLLFRHKPPRNFVDKFFANHQITRQDNTYLWPAGESLDKIMTLNEIFDLFNYPEIKMKYTTFSSVCDGLAKRGFSDIVDDIHDYYNQTQPYTKEEVEQYFIAKNPHWQDALSLLKREDIRSLRLKPVGVYIACRQLVKFTGDELSLDIYYK